MVACTGRGWWRGGGGCLGRVESLLTPLGTVSPTVGHCCRESTETHAAAGRYRKLVTSICRVTRVTMWCVVQRQSQRLVQRQADCGGMRSEHTSCMR